MKDKKRPMTLKDFNGAERLNFNCRFISNLFAILPNVFPGKIYFENILMISISLKWIKRYYITY